MCMATAGEPEARASCPGTTELGCELVVDSWLRPPFCQLGLNRAKCSLGPGHIWDRGLTGPLTPQVDGVGGDGDGYPRGRELCTVLFHL